MKFLKLLFLLAGLLAAARLSAQRIKQIPVSKIPIYGSVKDSVRIQDSIRASQKINSEMDVSDLIGKVLKHKQKKAVDTVTSKPSISVVPAIGYTLVSKLAVVMAGNVAFRSGPESRISSIVLSSSFTQRKQFTLPIESDIWSKNNEYNFVGDFRFYKYPQSTYGLGSNSNILHEDPMDYEYFRFYETILRHIAGNLYAGAGYILDDHWHIIDQGTFNDYKSYGTKPNHTVATGVTLNVLLDSRNNGINPSKGNFISIQYRDNVEFLGSTSGWRSLIVDVRKYINFPQGSDNVLALWSFDWLILSGEPGYLDLPSTQWDTYSATGRGYIQGRFRGADMVYAEAEYRYKILDNGLLGGVFFLNGESLSAAPGSKLESIQPGFGPGLRIKLNKVSKTNICIDYGFGREGSNGLFIDVGEIF
jgi:Omp85 superfamily domain